jgi:hypothetical protein
MTVAIKTKKPDKVEQIYSSQTGMNVLESIRKILQRDKFNLFNLRSTFEFDRKIEQSNRDIEKLMGLRSQGAEQIEKLTAELNKLQTQNQQRLSIIGGMLDAN